MYGGYALAGVVLLSRSQQGATRVGVGLGHHLEHQQHCAFFEYTVWFRGAGQASNDAPRGVFSFRRNTGQFQTAGIAGQQVTGYVTDHDGNVCANFVQILPGGVTLFCQQGIVVTPTRQPGGTGRVSPTLS